MNATNTMRVRGLRGWQSDKAKCEEAEKETGGE